MTNRVHYIRDQLALSTDEQRSSLGGKGASLCTMALAGLPVPPAFVIPTDCCRYFLENGGNWPPGLDQEVRDNLARLEQDVGRRYAQGAQPLLLGVRSGAAQSMPGMMDTLLNVGLHTGLADEVGDSAHFWGSLIEFTLTYAETACGMPRYSLAKAIRGTDQAPTRVLVEEAIEALEAETGTEFPRAPWDILVACINGVFRSWNSERAVQYRKRHGIDDRQGTAVNVQAMFPSHASGIVFTREPTRARSNRMVIEASYGLGAAVVSGDVTPDRFLVNRENFGDVETAVGNKDRSVPALGDDGDFDLSELCLAPEQVRELAELSLRVEEHYGTPMDLEFGLAEGEFSLLQCREIRGLDVLEDAEAARLEEIERLKRLASSERKVWVAHNLGETLQTPTPLTWDLIRHFMSGSGGFGRMYQDFGYRPAPEVKEEGFLELICGRIYADPRRLARLFWDCLPIAYDLESLKRSPKALDRAPSVFKPEESPPDLLLRLPRTVWSMLRSARTLRKARRNAHEVFEQQVLPPYREYVKQKRLQNLEKMTTAEVFAELHDRRRRVLDEFGAESLRPGFLGGLALDELTSLLTQLEDNGEGAALANTLSTALEGDVTFEQDVLLCRVARDEAQMGEFLQLYGHRCLGEMELMEPRYREDPSYLEQLAGQLKDARRLEDTHQENATRRDEAERTLPETLANWGGRSFASDVEELLRQTRTLLPYRETGKHYLMMGYELIRLAILELARRWDLGNDIFFLRLDELERFEKDREILGEVVAARKLRWRSAQQIALPEVIDSQELDELGQLSEVDVPSSGVLSGEAIAPGVATGPAAVIHDPRQTGALSAGSVLVCPSTDPAWTPLFIAAAGLVVERGGTLSHGAIVARDFGIPAVVCGNATSLITDGTKVRVDGNQGTLQILEEPDA